MGRATLNVGGTTAQAGDPRLNEQERMGGRVGQLVKYLFHKHKTQQEMKE